jgi:hypothetical protein
MASADEGRMPFGGVSKHGQSARLLAPSIGGELRYISLGAKRGPSKLIGKLLALGPGGGRALSFLTLACCESGDRGHLGPGLVPSDRPARVDGH